MLTDIHPKLPMRDKAATREFYIGLLGFKPFGHADYDGYLMLEKAGRLELKPWGQKEFSLLDPDHNLLTFGENIF